LDREPRTFSPEESNVLKSLAGMVVDQLELWLASREVLNRSKQQIAVATFSHDALLHNSLTECLDEAVRISSSILQVEHAMFVTLSGAQCDELSLCATTGFDISTSTNSSEPIKTDSFLGQVFSSSDPTAYRELPIHEEENRIARLPSWCVSIGAVQALGMRVMQSGDDRPFGALLVFSSDRRRPLELQAANFLKNLSVAITAAVHHHKDKAALEESEARFRAVISSASDAIFNTDETWRITHMNDSAQRMFGYSALECLGSTMSRLAMGTTEEAFSESSGNRTMMANLAGRPFESVMKRRDESTFFAELCISEVAENAKYGYSVVIRDITQRKKLEQDLLEDKKLADDLLRNMLPGKIVDRLKLDPSPIAESFPNCTVLFADLAGFTTLCTKMPAEEVVLLLNRLFTTFDVIVEKWNVEKIKTIGDCYMCVAGVPEPVSDHALVMCRVAHELVAATKAIGARYHYNVGLRVGINSGPCIAGVIGLRKFIYDTFGDTVNTASRMESCGVIGRIQISESTRQLLGDAMPVEPRGTVEVKGKGPMQTYFLLDDAASVSTSNSEALADEKQADSASSNSALPAVVAAWRRSALPDEMTRSPSELRLDRLGTASSDGGGGGMRPSNSTQSLESLLKQSHVGSFRKSNSSGGMRNHQGKSTSNSADSHLSSSFGSGNNSSSSGIFGKINVVNTLSTSGNSNSNFIVNSSSGSSSKHGISRVNSKTRSVVTESSCDRPPPPPSPFSPHMDDPLESHLSIHQTSKLPKIGPAARTRPVSILGPEIGTLP